MTLQLLTEVFGHNAKNLSEEASTCRKHRLCPYHNKIPNCNNDKAKNPLGVCSIFENGKPIIVCQVRLRQNWRVITDIVQEFFPEDTTWTTVADVKLYDKFNRVIDTIDFVIVAYGKKGNVIDFISLDNLGICLNGDLRQQFNSYMDNPKSYNSSKKGAAPQPSLDYATSLNKRLAPQVIYKSSTFNSWNKKTVYALDINLFQKLPQFVEVKKEEAEISWFSYELKLDPKSNNYNMQLAKITHTLFQPTLFEITKVEPGPIEEFITQLQQKLNERLIQDIPRNQDSFNHLFE